MSERLHLYLHDQFAAGATEVKITQGTIVGGLTEWYIQPIFPDEINREIRSLGLLYQKHGTVWVK